MIRLCALAALLILQGCGVPPAVLAGALGVTAGVLRLDNTLLDAWLMMREEKRVSVPTATVKAP
jgi:hypothetical protein